MLRKRTGDSLPISPSRKAFLSAIEMFVDYAAAHGSKSANKYYMIFSKLVKKYRFPCSEVLVIGELLDGIKNKHEYHAIYQSCKKILIHQIKSVDELAA